MTSGQVGARFIARQRSNFWAEGTARQRRAARRLARLFREQNKTVEAVPFPAAPYLLRMNLPGSYRVVRVAF